MFGICDLKLAEGILRVCLICFAEILTRSDILLRFVLEFTRGIQVKHPKVLQLVICYIVPDNNVQKEEHLIK